MSITYAVRLHGIKALSVIATVAAASEVCTGGSEPGRHIEATFGSGQHLGPAQLSTPPAKSPPPPPPRPWTGTLR